VLLGKSVLKRSMLIGIEDIGLDLHQFSLSLFATHPPMGNFNIIDQGYIPFLPLE